MENAKNLEKLRHDIRSKCFIVSGAVDVLKNCPNSPEIREMFAMMKAAVKEMEDNIVLMEQGMLAAQEECLSQKSTN